MRDSALRNQNWPFSHPRIPGSSGIGSRPIRKVGRGGTNLAKALEMYPNQAGAYLNLGLYYLERGQKEKAMALIEKGSQLMSKGTKLLYSVPSMEKCEGLVPPQEIKKQDAAGGDFTTSLDERSTKATRMVRRWRFTCWPWKTTVKTAMPMLKLANFAGSSTD